MMIGKLPHTKYGTTHYYRRNDERPLCGTGSHDLKYVRSDAPPTCRLCLSMVAAGRISEVRVV